eukprot:13452413-Alexandrium_andersonii.AAC.1
MQALAGRAGCAMKSRQSTTHIAPQASARHNCYDGSRCVQLKSPLARARCLLYTSPSPRD